MKEDSHRGCLTTHPGCHTCIYHTALSHKPPFEKCFEKEKSLFQRSYFCTSPPTTHTFISTTFHHFFKVDPAFHHVPIISLIHDTMYASILNPTSPSMKISTPLLRIARDISPYLGSMARISLKERKTKGRKIRRILVHLKTTNN